MGCSFPQSCGSINQGIERIGGIPVIPLSTHSSLNAVVSTRKTHLRLPSSKVLAASAEVG